ncbi:MAG: thiosulfate/3-mercaptopyruvate sulfurtransferase [Crocinitomix sp.]|jgi:thiosulfate/3-mercaptopyruvate sulfurtransferase
MKDLTTVDWLHENFHDKDLILLDASSQSNAQGNSSIHKSITIKNARFFDLKNKFANSSSPFPNTVPTAEQFELEARKLGINKTSKIVVFDNLGIYTSPRVWWLFKIMGHKNVSVLDGGLPAWINQGFATAAKYFTPNETGDFKVNFQQNLLKTYNDVLLNIDENQFTLIDARSKGRFEGVEDEPRKHLKSGHISNSINIPYKDLLTAGKFKSETELRKIFETQLTADKELVFSCGSGVTACIVMLAGHIANRKSLKLYDGSWSEWAELQGLIQG